jgi:DNA ligase (NAD+)
MSELSMQELVEYLNKCTVAYDQGNPIISDEEWDNLYFQLLDMEIKAGITEENSPTMKVHFKQVSALETVEHEHPMLSLDKTKDLDDVRKFIGKNSYIAMLKMDGLTCSLTYENGILVRAETRGNGISGENILHNARVIPSIPKTINYKEKLVVDGEIICTLTDFEMFASDYKNSRNFAAGSIRLLDAHECSKRHLSFVAWDVIEGYEEENELFWRLNEIEQLGFTTVPMIAIYLHQDGKYSETVGEDTIDHLKKQASFHGFPIDGIVYKFNDISYGKSLGATSHHFKNAIAYKFYDETHITKMRDIEWTMGRTGVLTPVAVFDPINIDGSTVERANLHNISVMTELMGGSYVGQEVEVFKANMIIPQIAKAAGIPEGKTINDVQRIVIPNTCPICGAPTEQVTENSSTVLRCTSSTCSGKLINRLDHFCGKKGLDIKGLSKATLEKLIDWNWVSDFTSIFMLADNKDEWVKKPGFGIKSVEKVLNAIDAARSCELHQFIAALGIPLIGTTASKQLAKEFETWEKFVEAAESDFKFYQLDNFGWEMHNAIKSFKFNEAKFLTNYIIFNSITKEETSQETSLEGMTFVITGKLSHFKNRDAIKDKIESLGGKVTGSVSKNTSYLINNDKDSTSAKNKSAKSLGIPILSENDFIQTFGIE